MTDCNVGWEQRRFARYDGSTASCASIVVVTQKPIVTAFVTSRSSNRGFFGTFERERQQRCLEVTSRPAMLVQSMRRVGLVDSTVGNACASAHRNVPPRDAARRTTSLRNARAAGDIPAALVRLARTVRLKRSGARGSETVWRLRATAVRRVADEIKFALGRDDDNAEGASSRHDHPIRLQ
jgi:hypothetical protein